jgi:hypothetical protein
MAGRMVMIKIEDVEKRSVRHVLGLEPLAGGARETAIGIAQHSIRGAIARPALFFWHRVRGVDPGRALPRL